MNTAVLDRAIFTTARILKADNSVSQNIYTYLGATDRHENYMMSDGRKQVYVHQTRILPIFDDGHTVTLVEGVPTVTCKQCQKVQEVARGTYIFNCRCGLEIKPSWVDISGVVQSFEADTSTEKNVITKKIQATKAKKAIVDSSVNIDKIAQRVLDSGGEVWVKDDVQFDYLQFRVVAYTLIMLTGRPRKICFNTYNGTWGKKSRDEELEAFLSDTPGPNGKDVGYLLKPGKNMLDIEHKNMVKKGYERYATDNG